MTGGGAMPGTDLSVELWTARAEWREGAVESVAVFTARAAHRPIRLRAARADGDVLVVGRPPERLPEEDHLSWTPEDAAEEDLALSRSQLRFSRKDHGWWVAVPGERESKRKATVRYWASGRSYELEAGDRGVLLDPSAHVCISVVTLKSCYWALVTTPAEARRDDPGPGHDRSSTQDSPVKTLGPDAPQSKLPSYPKDWRTAVQVKFRPFLTWPMDVFPGLVEPRHFIDPETEKNGTSQTFQGRVKHIVLDTQAAAAARGFEPREPSAIDVRLLEWLVARGEVRFEDDRVPWVGPDEAPPPRRGLIGRAKRAEGHGLAGARG